MVVSEHTHTYPSRLPLPNPPAQLPKVVEGSRFNGGALGDNLRPAEVWSTFTWFKQPHVDW